MLIVGKDRNKIDICNGKSLKDCPVSYTHLTLQTKLERQIPVLKVVRLNRTGVTKKSFDNQLIVEGFLFW